MKLISFNVNGVRAITKKTFFDDFQIMNPDVLCLQETKANDAQVQEALQGISGYHIYSSSAVRPGYSGTALISKEKPLSVTFGLGIEEHDQEGRIITAEYEKFFLVNTYVPNSGSELARLDYRETWDADLLKHLQNIEKTKPSIEYLGCSAEYFREYIKSKMTEEMTFDNIHYDHKKPVSAFDLAIEEELLNCCHYTNFQPLLATDNLIKSCKWSDEDELFWKENICGKEYFPLYIPR
jgi:exonuclease III